MIAKKLSKNRSKRYNDLISRYRQVLIRYENTQITENHLSHYNDTTSWNVYDNKCTQDTWTLHFGIPEYYRYIVLESLINEEFNEKEKIELNRIIKQKENQYKFRAKKNQN